jgi:hypothetical protein
MMKTKLSQRLEVVLMAIESMRDNPEVSHSNMAGFIRDALITIDWTEGETKDLRFISEGIEKALLQGIKTKTIAEHRVPNKVLISMMVAEVFTVDQLLAFLQKNLQEVFVTEEEDNLLRVAGLSSKMPSDGTDRYDFVGIKVSKNKAKIKAIRDLSLL